MTLTTEQARDYVESYFNGECATGLCTVDKQDTAIVEFTLRDGFQGRFTVWIERGIKGPYLYGEW